MFLGLGELTFFTKYTFFITCYVYLQGFNGPKASKRLRFTVRTIVLPRGMLSRTPGGHRQNAPGIGQDSDAVLSGMGLTAAHRQALREQGIVACAQRLGCRITGPWRPSPSPLWPIW